MLCIFWHPPINKPNHQVVSPFLQVSCFYHVCLCVPYISCVERGLAPSTWWHFWWHFLFNYRLRNVIIRQSVGLYLPENVIFRMRESCLGSRKSRVRIPPPRPPFFLIIRIIIKASGYSHSPFLFSGGTFRWRFFIF